MLLPWNKYSACVAEECMWSFYIVYCEKKYIENLMHCNENAIYYIYSFCRNCAVSVPISTFISNPFLGIFISNFRYWFFAVCYCLFKKYLAIHGREVWSFPIRLLRLWSGAEAASRTSRLTVRRTEAVEDKLKGNLMLAAGVKTNWESAPLPPPPPPRGQLYAVVSTRIRPYASRCRG
jgi:hypothetical protein